jgi:alkylation response protein AidB-like acyl-CoA dehydrogenase
MTILEAPAADAVLAAAIRLRPSIAAAAADIERERRVPQEIMNAIQDAGIFRMLLPREFGGGQVELPVAVAVTTEIARTDASAGWQVLVGAGNQYFLGKLGETSMRAAMAAGDDVLVRGALALRAPRGRCQAATGSLADGRWPAAATSRPGCRPDS